jgi:hypothetical protein
VRILLRLREDAADHPVAPAGQDDGAGIENVEGVSDNDNLSDIPQSVGTVEELKLNEQCGNVVENKGPLWKIGGQAGMLLKTNIVTREVQECY